MKREEREIKAERHAKIVEIVQSESIQTQEELALALRKAGFAATQATVSRDIKQMRLVKMQEGSGIYRYAVSALPQRGLSDRLIRVFQESVLSVECVNNMIIIKTISGSASAAAEGIDALKWPDVLGSIAGDNTILVILRNDSTARDVETRLQQMMKQ